MENFNFIKLSRVEMKDVLGGGVDPGLPGGPAVPGDGGGDGSGRCLTNYCHYIESESPVRIVVGSCETNSKNQCICNAGSSSVPEKSCVR